MSSGSPRPAIVPATDEQPEKGKFVYLELTHEAYKGTDPGTGEFLNLIRGDVARVSPAKSAQLLRDYPKQFKRSDRNAFERMEEDRSRRSKKLEEELRAKEKAAALGERQQAINSDDDDDS